MAKYGRFYPKIKRADDPFTEMKLYVPKSLHFILKAKSDEIHLPISKLVSICIDNELEVANSFYYPTELPTMPFVPDAYVHEAGLIYDFLLKTPYGMARDALLLARRDIGINSKDVLMLAYRELLQTGLIEEFYPEDATFRYPLHYRYVRRKDAETASIRRKKYKKQVGVTDE